MNYLHIDPESPIGQRFKELSQDPKVSDFYLTANEPLAYKVNGELVYDTVVHEVAVPDHLDPGCLDSAIDLHAGLADTLNQADHITSRGSSRWASTSLGSN